ncbi:hypothetical protein AB6A23_02120 [Paenibacillus tarimensis]
MVATTKECDNFKTYGKVDTEGDRGIYFPGLFSLDSGGLPLSEVLQQRLALSGLQEI